MRNLVAALVAVLLASLGAAAPVAAAQTSTAKVVIIVGATHGATAGYRANADAAYAEAIKYTARVTKVYSPNATWPKVQAATQGANIVIYFGHGNGWPSPYTFDPNYTTKDGFGLNADLNGDGALSDYENKYYGEPSMAQLGLAPNAIVMLHNLCYASGNSEPGHAAPTVSVARQRLDNYAAGFLKGNAEAVLADGHMGPAAYLRAMFTTGQSIVDAWKSAPNFHNHVSSFASTRSPGYTAYSDPETATTGFYRSLVTKPSLTTTAITKAVGDTGADPASLVVPGRAVVQAPPADPAAASADDGLLDLPEGTRLKTIAIASPATSDRPAVIQVEGLDDPSIAGHVSAASLAPRDSKAPALIGMDSGEAGSRRTATAGPTTCGSAARSPSRSRGRSRSRPATATSSSPPAARVPASTSPGTVWSTALPSRTAPTPGPPEASMPGRTASPPAAARSSSTLRGPAISALSPDGSTVSVFTPNGDAPATRSRPRSRSRAGHDRRPRHRRRRTRRSSPGPGRRLRAPTRSAGTGRPRAAPTSRTGSTTIRFTARDATGNERRLQGPRRQGHPVPERRPDLRQGLLPARRGSVRTHDSLSFTLAEPATVTWTIRNAAGATVATRLAAAPTAAGTQTWAWDGTNDAGARLPLGAYIASVAASAGGFAITHSVKVEMNAFAIATSTATAKRGSRLTVSVTSAEATSGSIRLYVTQPGHAVWAVTMTRVDSRNFKATITPKTGGSAGKISLKVWARRLRRRSQSTYRVLPLS